MGVTGLETAFAALYTGLVVPGVIDLDLLVERMTAGGAVDLAAPTLAKGSPAEHRLVDLDAAGAWGRPATRAAPTTPASPAASCEAGS